MELEMGDIEQDIKLMNYKLSRRERQIMDAVFALGESSVSDILNTIPNPPSAGAVRSAMVLLVKKGLLVSRYHGPRKVYTPTLGKHLAGRRALGNVLQTYFKGSVSLAVATLLDSSVQKLSDQEVDQIIGLIEKAEKEGK
jgi:predicted transcriptional regulator